MGAASQADEAPWRVPFFDCRDSFAAQWPDLAKEIGRVFDLNRFSHGVVTAELEEAVRRYTGARRAVGVNSATDGLQLILRALGVGPGDEAIVPTFGSFPCVAAVCHVGAVPVFVDVEPGSYTVAPEAVRAVLTARTRVILPVHVFGQPPDMTALRAIAGRAGVPVVEDSGHAIGVRYAAVHAGLLGAAGVLSFVPTATLGALGDAAIVVTDDDGLADQCSILRHHGRTGEIAGRTSDISSDAAVCGVNSKMDEIQAAVVLCRLPGLAAAIARRRELAGHYTRRLAATVGIRPPLDVPRGETVVRVWAAYVIEADSRDALRRHLAEAGIEARVPQPLPLHRQPCFAHLGGGDGDHPVAEAAAQRTLALPLHPDLGHDRVDYVCDAIQRFDPRTRI